MAHIWCLSFEFEEKGNRYLLDEVSSFQPFAPSTSMHKKTESITKNFEIAKQLISVLLWALDAKLGTTFDHKLCELNMRSIDTLQDGQIKMRAWLEMVTDKPKFWRGFTPDSTTLDNPLPGYAKRCYPHNKSNWTKPLLSWPLHPRSHQDSIWSAPKLIIHIYGLIISDCSLNCIINKIFSFSKKFKH